MTAVAADPGLARCPFCKRTGPVDPGDGLGCCIRGSNAGYWNYENGKWYRDGDEAPPTPGNNPPPISGELEQPRSRHATPPYTAPTLTALGHPRDWRTSELLRRAAQMLEPFAWGAAIAAELNIRAQQLEQSCAISFESPTALEVMREIGEVRP